MASIKELGSRAFELITLPTQNANFFFNAKKELRPVISESGLPDHAATARRQGRMALDHLLQMIPGDKVVYGAALGAGLAGWNDAPNAKTRKLEIAIAGTIGGIGGAVLDAVEIIASPVTAAIFGISAGLHYLQS